MKLPRPGWTGTGNRWQSAPLRIQTIARTQNRLHDIQRRHFDQSVILLCVRWYLAYGLSLRDLNEMMAERGISVDHSTVHRWVVPFSPILLKRFNRRKRAVGSKWHMDETYKYMRWRKRKPREGYGQRQEGKTGVGERGREEVRKEGEGETTEETNIKKSGEGFSGSKASGCISTERSTARVIRSISGPMNIDDWRRGRDSNPRDRLTGLLP